MQKFDSLLEKLSYQTISNPHRFEEYKGDLRRVCAVKINGRKSHRMYGFMFGDDLILLRAQPKNPDWPTADQRKHLLRQIDDAQADLNRRLQEG